jgi:hypothetical protein
MTKIMKGGVAYNATSNMVALTQAEYNSLSTAQKNNGNFYFIVDSDPSYFSAENIDYDNTDSGLTATDIQTAIDEVNTKVNSKASTNWICYYEASYGNPAKISMGVNYASILLIGCVQGIGGVAILIKITTGSISSTIDMYTGNTFSNSNLTIAYTNQQLVLTQNSTSGGRSFFIATRIGF